MNQKVGRRNFIKMAGSTVVATFLAACGTSNKTTPDTPPSAVLSETGPPDTPNVTATSTPQLQPTPAPTLYYVDSETGDDQNDGTSHATPFQTLRRTMHDLKEGDTIALARGSYFREEFVSTLPRITVVDYGEGERPVIDCSDVLDNQLFAREQADQHVYRTTIWPDLHESKSWINVWENGEYLQRAASVEECGLNPGTYFVTADIGAPPVDLYVHAKDSADIRESFSRYEVSMRKYAINLQFSENAQVIGIRTQRNLHDNGSAIVGRFSLIQDCVFRDGGKHNVYVSTGCEVTDCLAHNAYHGDGSATMYVYNEGEPRGEGVVFINCSAQSDHPNTTVNGFGGHKNLDGTFGEVTYMQCSTVGLDVGFATANDADLVTYDTCHSEACRIGFALASSERYRLVQCTCLDVSQLIVTRADGILVEIEGLSCTMNVTNGSAISVKDDQVQLIIADSNISMAPTAGESRLNVLRVSGLGSSITSNSNTFSGFQGHLYHFNDSVNFTSDKNCFDPFSSVKIGETVYDDFTTYVSQTGQDKQSAVDSC